MKKTARTLTLLAVLAGCGDHLGRVARNAAQPDTPPMRNITSFTAALTCMDRLFKASGRRSVLLSSSDIPDLTRRLPIGGDDMLINAISQMNRHSRSYLFLDQVRYKKDGNIDFMIVKKERDEEPRPEYYIRGSISQVDRDVHSTKVDLNIKHGVPESDRNESYASDSLFSRRLSIVSVDMHLVHYASRRVVPGASVANSMVVIGRGWGIGAAGTIDLTEIDLVLQIDRVESEAQAARNLIELGAIELLGKHARVPYQRCLAPAFGQALPTPNPPPATSTKATAKATKAVPPAPVRQPSTKTSTLRSTNPVRTTQPAVAREHPSPTREDPIRAARLALVLLGYLSSAPNGPWDATSRNAMLAFQAEEGLSPTGKTDTASMSRLKLRLISR